MVREQVGDEGHQILHCFADYGVEAEALSIYGDVTRVGLAPRPNEFSSAVAADASKVDELPFRESQFDLALLHPPCTRWSRMTRISGDPDDHPDLIGEARAIGEKYADNYVIENVPEAPLRDPVVLEGKMFGLPIEYGRAFESSFPMEQPPRQQTLDVETSTFFYSGNSPKWWRTIKGVRGDYPKEHVAKNCLPLNYVHYLIRSWLEASGHEDGLTDYSNYDARMDERRAREANHSLEGFANAE